MTGLLASVEEAIREANMENIFKIWQQNAEQSHTFFSTGATTHWGFIFCNPLAGL